MYGKLIPRSFYHDYFDKSQYSQLAVKVLNALKIKNPKDVYIDETEDALLITIPKDYSIRIHPKYFLNRCKELIDDYNKPIKIFIEGKLTTGFGCWEYGSSYTNKDVYDFLNLFGYNIEELNIKVGYNEYNNITVDLSMFNINNLKITMLPNEHTYHAYDYIPVKVITNRQFKPKKYRLIDKRTNKNK